MRETEVYLNRATRGLWGQKRRDAQTELRGAIEDKVYRYRLLGLSEAEAARAALRDLGSPHAIARDLSRVHTPRKGSRRTPSRGCHAARRAGAGAGADGECSFFDSSTFLPVE
ncbi:permease prefix domain 1-containing protein [Deinococcus apachensis]|uniref:permease prefix domain 1-containing protein n=1 Tax=Deinococcus apachensis TaxID=309886 RepID=UPI00037F35F3|nr:permease prefix domain 1-containing protein [Deinococcus apachensis]